MHAVLAADHAGQHLAAVFQHGGGGVIAGTFNGKDEHGAVLFVSDLGGAGRHVIMVTNPAKVN